MPGQSNIDSSPRSLRRTANNLILHLHPPKVPKDAIRFAQTFGLGGMAALLVVLQMLTGVLLKFQYIPTVDQAYQSVLAIRAEMVFGQLVLNIHHWTAQLLVIITFLHMARVVVTSACYPPRRSNWLIGIGLFLGVILMNFTGYLLPWDQLSYWAVTVAGSMLDYVPLVGKAVKFQLMGGDNVGQATLMNFYHFHTGVLPILLVTLMVYHFWKVRKAKGIILPGHPLENGNRIMVPTIPDLVKKELVTGLVLVAFVLCISLLLNAPLKETANPSISPNPAKAPWYFLGIQELIVHLHPFLSVVLVPLLLLVGSVLIPFSKRRVVNAGVWFSSAGMKRKLLQLSVFTLVLVPAWIITNEFIPPLSQWMAGLPLWISEGIIPFIIFTGIAFIAGWWILDKFKLAYNELIMSGFVFIATAYLVLMAIGIFLRGPGMELTFFKG